MRLLRSIVNDYNLYKDLIANQSDFPWLIISSWLLMMSGFVYLTVFVIFCKYKILTTEERVLFFPTTSKFLTIKVERSTYETFSKPSTSVLNWFPTFFTSFYESSISFVCFIYPQLISKMVPFSKNGFFVNL